MTAIRPPRAPAPFTDIQLATRQHRTEHGCGAYTFEDGPSLVALAAKLQPKRILELGTALGYTACCMAHGCSTATVDTVEGDAEHVMLAVAHIARHELQSRVSVHSGQFDDVLQQFAHGYDLIFFDGFAPPPKTVARLRQLLAAGGVLVCSNLQLASGQAARQLSLEFNNERRWRPLAPIENGRTRVMVKLGA